MCKRIKLLLGIAGLAVALYAGSYLGLSRRGYAEADEYRLKGFYYLCPKDSDTWRYSHYSCVILYWPANFFDRCIGLGRYPASEPLWGLSGGVKK